MTILHAEHDRALLLGRPVRIDVRDEHVGPAALGAAWDAVRAELAAASRAFSPDDPESALARLRSGARFVADDGVAAVLDRCLEARTLTHGAFDPWALPGGFDPSGLLHGWAADVCARVLHRHGLRRFAVDVGGDLVCRGADSCTAWTVGVADPDDPARTIAALEVADAAVATSRGASTIDPRTGLRAAGARQATVVGPDAALADALATALVVAGAEGARWFAHLPGWSACVVEGDELAWWGPALVTS